ncbi:MAG: hypothetical protein GY858_00565 [Candidatus Omnitrophica bacterium]|nr:hypothetical protein [Candidatus Omnitrophota bacterium]
MPRKDGTGPNSQGFGLRGGFGRGQERRFSGLGGGVVGKGSGGYCVCSSCGEKAPHQRRNPCSSIKCSKCGAVMVRA